jgi:hypothetical protein
MLIWNEVYVDLCDRRDCPSCPLNLGENSRHALCLEEDADSWHGLVAHLFLDDVAGVSTGQSLRVWKYRLP